MHFTTISGYAQTKKHLLNIVHTQQIPPTQLFAGPPGSGSLALALAFVTYLYCTNKTPTDSCGTCSHCSKINKHIHPDLHYFFPIGTTRHIKGKEVNTAQFLPQWRSFLAKTLYGNLEDWSEHLHNEAKQLYINKAQAQEIKKIVSLKPFNSTHKVVLVWQPEHLHMVAANTLLKTLEEPPNNTLFVLVATDVTKILPTLRSRTSQIHLPPFTDEALLQMLKRQYTNHTDTQREHIVKQAQGNLTKAQKLAMQTTGSHFESFAQWLRAAYMQHWSRLVSFTKEFYKYPQQLQKNWIAYGLQLTQATLLVRFDKKYLLQLTQEEATFCQKLSLALSQEQIEAILHQLEKMHQVLANNAHAKLLLLSTSLHLAKTIGKPIGLTKPLLKQKQLS